MKSKQMHKGNEWWYFSDIPPHTPAFLSCCTKGLLQIKLFFYMQVNRRTHMLSLTLSELLLYRLIWFIRLLFPHNGLWITCIDQFLLVKRREEPEWCLRIQYLKVCFGLEFFPRKRETTFNHRGLNMLIEYVGIRFQMTADSPGLTVIRLWNRHYVPNIRT